MKLEFACRRRGVNTLVQTLKANIALAQFGHARNQIGEGAPKPVQAPDHQRIPWAELRQALLPARPVGTGTRELVGKQVALVDAGCAQCIKLKVEALVFG